MTTKTPGTPGAPGAKSKEWQLQQLLKQLRVMSALRETREGADVSKARTLIEQALELIVPEPNDTTRQLRANFRDDHGSSLLQLVAHLGTPEQALQLRMQGAHPSIQDVHQRNAFHYLGLRTTDDAAVLLEVLATPSEDLDLSTSMLADPVSVPDALNAAMCSGATPLHVASVTGTHILGRLMPLCGADPDAQDQSLQTPLFKAVQNSHAIMCKALIASQASLDILDRSHRYAVDYAVDRPKVQKVLHRAETYGFGPYDPDAALADFYPALNIAAAPRAPGPGAGVRV